MHANIIREEIVHGAGQTHDAASTAKAVVILLQRIHDELGAVVGGAAAGALSAHAIHRTRTVLTWSMPPVASLSESTLQSLQEDLRMRSTSECQQAGELLLTGLLDHLIALIGQQLTYRILDSALRIAIPDSNREIDINE